MAKGRKALPDAIKALKGNPGGHKLMLQDAAEAKDIAARAASAPLVSLPGFLTHKREREIFRRAVEDFFQRRVAKAADTTAYGRWAYYVHRWILCKEQLDKKASWFTQKSRNGTAHRRHPVFRDLLDLERLLCGLEDRLGLNPVARQSIIRGLAAMPAPVAGVMSDQEEPTKDERPMPPPGPEASPLGYLQSAGKLN